MGAAIVVLEVPADQLSFAVAGEALGEAWQRIVETTADHCDGQAAGIAEALPPVPAWFDEESAPQTVDVLMANPGRVDGLVCANDELALATMAHLARRGVRVPDDVALVGFDDLMASRYVAPGLTTVQQPTAELGRWGAIRLHERIQGRTHDVEPQVLPTRVVVRGSCGCPWDGPALPAATVGTERTSLGE